jgi:hypothetical protein
LCHVYFYPETEDVEAFNFSAVEDIDKMVASEECFMTDALIALGTGKTKKDILPPHDRDSNQSQKNQHAAFWVATNMMR